MRRDAQSVGRRARANPLFLEHLEERRLLSGAASIGDSPTTAAALLGDGTPDAPAVVRTAAQPLGVGGSASGPAAADYPAVYGSSSPSDGSQNNLKDPTPDGESGATANGRGTADPAAASYAQQNYLGAAGILYDAPYRANLSADPGQGSEGGAGGAYVPQLGGEARPAQPAVSPLPAPDPVRGPAAAAEAGGGTANPAAGVRPLQGSRSGDALSADAPPTPPSEQPPPGIPEEALKSPTDPAGGEPFRLPPPLGGLLASAYPADLPTLERAADRFFARLGALTESMAASRAAVRLDQWLAMAAAAAGGVTAVAAFEFARRRFKRAERDRRAGSDGAGDPSWAPFPVLAFIPPEDQP